MAIPDYQTLMLPVLHVAGDGQEHLVSDFRMHVAALLKLSDEDLAERLPSGKGSLFASRVAWAVQYLKQARVISGVRRGVYQITDRGRSLLNGKPSEITVKTLRQYPEFAEFEGKGVEARQYGMPGLDAAESAISLGAPLNDSKATPEESLESSFQILRETLANDLLDIIRNGTPAAFEQVVVDLLVAMGYGGSVEDAGKVVGKSGDGGIDGVIKQDKLGLDVIYVQAKRWANVVGSPEIMKFSGSLTKQHANRGVFITTSTFTKDASDYVKGIPQKIVLIDGKLLATLMMEHDVGVAPTKTYVLKRLDQDYFENI